MKLPIKKKWFDKIKSGDKEIEWRDAHITFVCEETGETLRKDIRAASIYPKLKYSDWDIPDMTFEEFDEMFQDDTVIAFVLK